MTVFRSYVPQEQRSDRSAGDRKRHRQKIKNTLRENIADILAEESIIGQNGGKIIKVPIRSVKEYRFIYGDNSAGVAQGSGKSNPGDVVHKGDPGQPDAAGEAGNAPGIDAIETDVTLEELIAIMFEDLELPELQKKSLKEIPSDRAFRRHGHRRQGIRARLDKHRTAKQRIKRMFAQERAGKNPENLDAVNESLAQDVLHEEGDEKRFPFHERDMVFHHVTTDTKNESNAVVMCIMDTSGSMGTVKKYLARSFYFLLYQFIRMKYQTVDICFISHHTEAKEVTEEEFFHKVESGGTYISSGYEKALEIIQERYHPSLWNIYAFHCSDGDNFYSDNEKCVTAAQELCDVCNLFGYGEIKPSGSSYYSSSMLEVFEAVDRKNFQTIVIEKKEDLWKGLKIFLSKDQKAREAAMAEE
jgi:uncharacterized protein